MSSGLEQIRQLIVSSKDEAVKRNLQRYVDQVETKEREAAERLANMTESERQFLREEQEKEAREAEERKKLQEEESRISKLISSGIPRRFYEADVNNIDADIIKLCTGKTGLFLHGSAGTGKTYLAVALLKEMGTPRRSFITAPGLLLKIRSSFKEGAGHTEEEVINHYGSISPLVIDDLGVEKSSEFALQSLYLIIDKRYSEEAPTIFTSNLSLSDIAIKIGDRIASRIAEMCQIVELKGKDRRLL